MNTFELWDALHHDPHGKDKTAGVFPRDYLAKIRKRRYPFGVIINTSKASDRDGGTHWVAVWIESGKDAEFFDSFGKTAIFYGVEIHDFITRMAPQFVGKYKENYTQLQHPSSDLCGLFSLYYLYHKYRGYALRRIIFSFTYPKNLKSNDALLRKFAIKNLHFCNNARKCVDADALRLPEMHSLKMCKILNS
ncbi:hypothetical protein RvY_02352 [Ramazzottius varieornatus]|uniref:Ubiquitin-like protease family profile domain-containing protein n=1 Tax=Ramazzottius varieornatus TaxID=947166 RepID=A0A1D1UMS6_RAMVA|nr:hypothetical protein RvY_02352 [Ramazzottius varieornatus]